MTADVATMAARIWFCCVIGLYASTFLVLLALAVTS
jgi:hypothetical protein